MKSILNCLISAISFIAYINNDAMAFTISNQKGVGYSVRSRNVNSLSILSARRDNRIQQHCEDVSSIIKQTATLLCSVALMFNVHVGSVDAAVAPLADVGLREFLVKDGKELLRLSIPSTLPQTSNAEKVGDWGRSLQEHTELVRLRLEQVGFSGKTAVWSACLKEVNAAKSDLVKVDGSAEEKTNIGNKLDELANALRKQDIVDTLKLQEDAAAAVGDLRLASLVPGELPFEIPNDYKDLPRLKGRTTVQCVLSKNNGGSFRLEDGTQSKAATLLLVIDGYHAPITGGNFVDLVQRGFYDGMKLKAEGELLVESQDIDFVDPKTREVRQLPLELFYKRDSSPVYEYTSDEDMRATEGFSLPFQAYGALGMEHDPENVNTASSKFWFLRWDQALVSPGRNTIDGSHTCFGYVVNSQDLLKQISSGDKIESMKVISGASNLIKA